MKIKQDQIIPILQECTKDRMLKVQSSAKQALKEWQALKQKIEELEKKKLTKKVKISKDYIDPDEIINSKTADVQDQVSQLKKRPKQQVRTVILENDNGIKNVLNKQGGWVNELKAKNFIRKQTGVGGGRTVLNESRLKIQKTAINQQQRYQDLRDDLKTRKMQQQEQNEYSEITLFQNQKRLPTNDEQENQIQNSINEPSNMLVSKRQMYDNFINPNENASNNFYNSKLQNLQTIQKSQQQLIEEQLKLYPHNSSIEDRHFVVPPQSIYPYQLNDKNDMNSQLARQRYQESQPEFLIMDQSPQESQFHQKKQSGSPKINQNLNQDIVVAQDYLEETQDFNEIDFKHKMESQNSPNLIKSKPISQVWEDAVQMVEQGNIDEAFEIILDSEDDIYLIRLIMRTGIQLEKLKRYTAIRAIHRFLLIQKSNFVNKLCFEFYQDSIDSGLQDQLLIEDQREMYGTLDQLSHSSNLETKQFANNILSQTNIYKGKH